MEEKFNQVARLWSGDDRVTVRFADEVISEDGAECDGLHSNKDKSITLRLGMTADRTLMVFIHEIVHCLQFKDSTYDPDSSDLVASYGHDAVAQMKGSLSSNLESQAEFFSAFWFADIPDGTLQERLQWMLDNPP